MKIYIYEIPSQSSFYKQKETYSSIQKVKKTINIKTDFLIEFLIVILK